MGWIEGILAAVGIVFCMAVDSPGQAGMTAAGIAAACFAVCGIIESKRSR